MRVKYSGDKFNVLSITGRRHYRDDMDYDFDMTSLSSMTSKTVDESTSLSQEIRISSVENNDPFQWLTGVYFFDEDIQIYQDKISQTTTTIRNTDVDSFGYAFFGQGTYTFIDRLHLTAGLRYDFTDFNGEQEFTSGGTQTIYAEIDNWISTEYDSTTGSSYQYDYSGNRLPNVPNYTYNLGVQYRHMSGFFCRADWLGTGSVYSDSKNTAKEDGYGIFNLRLGFESENYDIHLWCKNLFDEEYLQVRFASSGAHQGLDGDPRMMGISFTYRF